ncbi:MAG: hypothetical protein ACLP3B_06280 [Syntrophobacteraceae bacterium]
MGLDEDHAALIRVAIPRIQGGTQRLSVAPIADSMKILLEPPHIVEWDDQDYGVSKDISVISSQYYEEIKIIETLLIEMVQLGQFEIIQQVFEKAGNDKYARNRAIAGYARQLWRDHAIPIRVNDGKICVIWPPEDVLHSPIVHEYNPGEFFAATGNTVLEIRKAFEREKKKVAIWKRIGTLSIVVFALLGLMGFSFLLR